MVVLLGVMVMAFMLYGGAAAASRISGLPLLTPQVLPTHPGGEDNADHAAMHDACLAGDWDAMEDAMDQVHPGWRGHMGNGIGMHRFAGMKGGTGTMCGSQ